MIIDHVVRWFSPMWRGRRVLAGMVAAATVATGVIVGWDHAGDRAPQVRLRSGIAWVASDETGQLTLLDGASAAVAGQVQVGQPGTDLDAVQQGTTGYALNRAVGSVVRVDGATLELSRPLAPVARPGAQLSVFATPHALYTLDSARGLLVKADPETMESRGEPHQLTAGTSVDEAVMDADGHLWALDQRSGELVWFSDGTRHSRPQAHTPGKSKLTTTANGPAVVDLARGTVELLDPKTGAVQESVTVPLRPDDTVAVSGSSQEGRLLIAVGSRGQFLSCSFDADACTAPVEVSQGPADLGEPVEADGHVVVPDHATGRIWVIDLASGRVVAERRLFEAPVRFELLARDGVVFYNDPGGEQAGVIDPDGRIRPITKYQPGQRTQPTSSGAATSGPGAAAPVSGAPVSGAPPATGPRGGTPGDSRPGTPSAPALSITISPRDRGLVGDEFQFTVTARGTVLFDTQWTFGDGAGAKGTRVRHKYDRAGTYTVAVAARARHGQAVNASAQVVVDALDAPPRIVRIAVEPETPRVGEQVRFSAELAGMRPQITAWSVTGEAGTEATSNEPVFQHVFTKPGTYTATHTVTAGATTVQSSKQFTVTPETREVRCGDVIRADVVLTKDLNCTGDVGLKIAASDVVLDLGGHKIATDNAQAPRKGIVLAGSEPIRNITIRNGSITQFRTGIEIIDVADVTIANATVAGATVPLDEEVFGIYGEKARNVQLRSTTLRAYNPFLFDNGSSVAFVGSSVVGDDGWGGAYCRNGTSCLFSEGSDIQTRYLNCGGSERDSSTFRIDSSEVVLVEFFGAACAETVVTNSLIKGLINVDGDKNFVSRNVMDNNPTMVVRGEFVVADNVFSGAQTQGLNIEDGYRIGIKGEVVRNTITGSRGYGLHVQQHMPDEPVGSLIISQNKFISNGLDPEHPVYGRDGLRIEELIPGTHVEVSDNYAENNGEYGMIAPPGTVTIDLRNSETGNPKGCLNITCD
ncbi:PKD domain-containing protein [Kibdelosporangium persicum]|uniref:Right handed beta helix region n=1 Tax=Kibdelosporangium persicum TaxID=2698649 RepID=A0ABX2FGX1_9PSEU|nr:PKD domain-containing protein [Kibdelosporangium persicum]NRN70018.1 Right handed beta helix region [Kibdelosporangium persicum]